MNPWKWLTSKFKTEPLEPVTPARSYSVVEPPSNVEVKMPKLNTWDDHENEWIHANPFTLSKYGTNTPAETKTTTNTFPVTVSEVATPVHVTTEDIPVITTLPEKSEPEEKVNEVNKD